MTLVEQIENVYRFIGDDRLEKLGLLHIEDGKLITPLADDTLSLLSYRCKRDDVMVERSIVEGLISAIKASEGYKGINHIGFCYKVASLENEVKRIVGVAGSKEFSVYQEPSTNDTAWLFVGDLSEVTNPMLEFLPHEGKVDDEWIDYWLPHIQFDIDTGMSADEITALIKKFIDRPFTPYSIKIDEVTYIQRVNIGCVEGVSLILDLSTNRRDINYRSSWDKLA